MGKLKAVTSMVKTLDVLKKHGYVDNDRYSNTGEVFNWKYKDDFLDSTASKSDTLYSWLFEKHYNKYIGLGVECIDISGFYKTKRRLASFHFEMPVEFKTERACLVWYYYYLISVLKKDWQEYCRYKVPPIQITRTDLAEMPQYLEEKNNTVERILELKRKKDVLHFTISREELKRLRKYVNNSNKADEREEKVKVYFDGDFVTWIAKDYKFAGVATGIEWPNPIMLSFNSNWRLPARLGGYIHVLRFCEDGLFIDNVLNREVKVLGSTSGKIDVFEPELLSWLVKLASMYPKYEVKVNSKLDEEDFKAWMIRELGPLFNPYMDILVAMVATCPFFDKFNESYMESAIRFFKEYPKDTDPLDIYNDWQKSSLANVFDSIMFDRAEAGWKCWCNNP